MNDKTYKKNLGRRALSLVLSFVMVLSLVQVGAFAAAEDGSDQIGRYADYNEAGLRVGDTDTPTNVVEDGDVTMTKSIAAAGKDTFDITLVVTTKEKLEDVPMSPDAAVVLVMDASDSMKQTVEGKKTDNNDDRRLTKAKASAGEFVDNFAADANGAKRYISVVKFNTNADTVVGWTDAAASETARNAIKTGINGITTDAATNVEAGLQLAYNLLGADTVKDVASRFVVLLTDGAPVGHKTGNGNLNSVPGTYSSNWSSETYVKESADKGTAAAGKIKTERKATLYTLAFASDTDVIYNGYEKDTSYWCEGDGSHQYSHGPWTSTCKGQLHYVKQSEYVNEKLTVGDWLKNSIASSSECHKNATTGQQLSISFGQIVEQIKKLMQAWQVTDPMGAMVEFQGLRAANRNVEMKNGTLTWNLWQEKPVNDPATGTYTYTLTYRVGLKTDDPSFEENTYYETNGVTALTYALDLLKDDGSINQEADVKTGYFNVPTVKGEKPEVNYTIEYYLMDKKTGEYKIKDSESGTAKLWETVTASKDFTDDDYHFVEGEKSMQLTQDGQVLRLYYALTPAQVTVNHYVITKTLTDDGVTYSERALEEVRTYPVEPDKLWKGDSFTNKYFLDGYTRVEQNETVNGYTSDQWAGVPLNDASTKIDIYYVKTVDEQTYTDYTIHYFYKEGRYELVNGQYQVVYGSYSDTPDSTITGSALVGTDVTAPAPDASYELDYVSFNGADNDESLTVTLVDGENVVNVYAKKAPAPLTETAKLTIVHQYYTRTVGEARHYDGEVKEYENETVYVGERYTASGAQGYLTFDENSDYVRETLAEAMSVSIDEAGKSYTVTVTYLRDARESVEVVEHHEYHHYVWEINAETGAGGWKEITDASVPATNEFTVTGDHYAGETYEPTQLPIGGYRLDEDDSDEEGRVLESGRNVFHMVYKWYEGEAVDAADLTVHHFFRTYTTKVENGKIVYNVLTTEPADDKTVYGKPGDVVTAEKRQDKIDEGFVPQFTDDVLTVTLVEPGQELNLYYDKFVSELGEGFPVMVQAIYKTYTDGVLTNTVTKDPVEYGTYYAGMTVNVPTSYLSWNPDAMEAYTYDAADEKNSPAVSEGATSIVIEKVQADQGVIVLVYRKDVTTEKEPAAVIVNNYYHYELTYLDENGQIQTLKKDSSSTLGVDKTYSAGDTFQTDGYAVARPGYVLRTDVTQPESEITLAAGINTVNFYWECIESRLESATVEVIHHYTVHDANPNVADSVWFEGSAPIQAYAGQRFVATPNTYRDFYTLTDVTPSGAHEGEGIVLTSGRNVIHLYYVAEIDTRVETRVTVKHIYYNNADALAAGTVEGESIVSTTAMEGDKFTAVTKTEFNTLAYTFFSADPANLTVTVDRDAEKNVITLRYLRAESFYTVEHVYYTDGKLTGSTEQRIAAKAGDTVNAADVTKITEYAGNTYTYTSAEPGSITVTAEGGKITLRYDRSTKIELPTYFDLTVRYLDQDTGASIAGAYTASIEKNQRYDVTDKDAIAISGYTYASTTGDALTGLMTGDKLITVYYTKNTSGGDDGDGDNGGGGGGTITIPDEEPPKTDLPDETVDLPDEDVPLADLPEEEVPLADVPKTGDASAVWMALAAASGMGLAALTFLGRKKDEEEA